MHLVYAEKNIYSYECMYACIVVIQNPNLYSIQPHDGSLRSAGICKPNDCKALWIHPHIRKRIWAQKLDQNFNQHVFGQTSIV